MTIARRTEAMDRQTHKKPNKQMMDKKRQIDRQLNGQTDKTNRQVIDQQIHRQTDIDID